MFDPNNVYTIDVSQDVSIYSVNDWYNPNWGGGYNATFDITITDEIAQDGVLEGFVLDVDHSNSSASFSNGWLTSYNGSVSFDTGEGIFTNGDQSYKPQLEVGDTIRFSIQVQNVGFNISDLTFRFADLDAHYPRSLNLVGTGGSDQLVGDIFDDVLNGLGGNDSLIGGLANDTYIFDADSGVDVITDVGGDDVIEFTDGTTANDLSIERDGNGDLVINIGSNRSITVTDYFNNSDNIVETIRFQNGDTVDVAELITPLVDVNPNFRTILGTSGNDLLVAQDGRDAFDGLEGNDTVSYINSNGSVTASLAEGGALNDGSGVNDTFVSIENLTGSNHGDFLYGDGDANILNGNGGGDTIKGFGGNDTINGGDGTDGLFGGDGADVISGGAGADRIYGEEGDDILSGQDGRDLFNGGIGSDTVTYETAAGAVNASLLDGSAINDGYGFNDIFVGVENLTGSNFDDFLYGDNNANVLIGLDGNDVIKGFDGDDEISGGDGQDALYGGAGDDTISAGSGNDNVRGGADNDIIFGGAGNDKLYGDEGNDHITGGDGRDLLFGGDGSDTASYATSQNGVNASLQGGFSINDGFGYNDVYISIENLEGSEFADYLYGDNNVNQIDGLGGNDIIKAFSGDDIINAGDGDDYIEGGEGSDTINGGDGNDTILGGEGYDVIDGGAGRDTVNYSRESGAINVVYNGNVKSGVVNKISGEYDLVDNVDRIVGSMYNDVISGGLNMIYSGLDGNDTITAGGGADILFGGSGHDVLDGGNYRDRYYGGSGNDTFYSGRGGNHIDTIYYDDATSTDDRLVYNANVAHDQLWFERIGDNLQITVIGETDNVTVDGWYSDGFAVDNIEAGDGYVLTSGDVQTLVDAMASFSKPALGQTDLTGATEVALDPIITSVWNA